ncbi:MAG TPA: HAD family hydrolase [Terriglobales bacterium]|nr:HAD family hydrolase [Terriglobales bacterium]
MASSFENGSQTLLIDADDTLWENNIYFERAIAAFISFLDHKQYSPPQVREFLNDVERGIILKHGYGLHSFAHALVETFERLSVEPITPELHQKIVGFAHAIAEHPVEIIEGVPETLDYLAERHHLILVTKGNLTAQTGKVERSGLKSYFAATEVVSEKDPSVYRELVQRYGLSTEVTWMVGNSPKSDINPAIAASLNAVFVPHGNTWVLEHEELYPEPAHRRLLVLKRFSELRAYF